MNPKLLTATLLLSAIFGTSCVHRTVSRDFGLNNLSAPQNPKRSARLSPDASLRAIFQQQTQAAVSAPEQSKETISEFEKQVLAHPSANSWNELGLLYEKAHSLPAAESAFQSAVAANPAWAPSHNNLGYDLLLQDRLDAAEAEFRIAAELNPSSVTARNNLATVLARRGDTKGALEQFQMAADPATAHNNLAVVLLEIGKYEESREQLVEALRIRHYFAPALENFKLVQEHIREQTDTQKFGRLPLNPVRIPSSAIALNLRIDNEEIFNPFLERN
jgi:tetratricopeptide (TPR) repeat protein